jgi:hypothetical protein
MHKKGVKMKKIVAIGMIVLFLALTHAAIAMDPDHASVICPGAAKWRIRLLNVEGKFLRYYCAVSYTVLPSGVLEIEPYNGGDPYHLSGGMWVTERNAY